MTALSDTGRPLFHPAPAPLQARGYNCLFFVYYCNYAESGFSIYRIAKLNRRVPRLPVDTQCVPVHRLYPEVRRRRRSTSTLILDGTSLTAFDFRFTCSALARWPDSRSRSRRLTRRIGPRAPARIRHSQERRNAIRPVARSPLCRVRGPPELASTRAAAAPAVLAATGDG